MTADLANITKTDLAAEVDRLRAQFNELCIDAHKLEIELVGAQTEIAKLQGEITELAARPCLACTLAPQRCEQIEDALHGALLLLDRIDKSELAATPRWSDWTEFEAERAELWAIFNRLVRGQN